MHVVDRLESGTVTKDKQVAPPWTSRLRPWNKRHKFRIPASILLADILFARGYRQINASAKKLKVIMPKQLRTLDCCDSGLG